MRPAFLVAALLFASRAFGDASVPPKGEPDPKKPIGLAQALAGVSGTGKLFADIAVATESFDGVIRCELFEKEAPLTVANFVGLARGVRTWWRSDSHPTKDRLYDGTTFHRVIPEFMIQGGDPAGNGTGGPGYDLADEIVASLKFDRPGRLAMANRGPNTNGSQFFITEVPTPFLDGKYSIFGQCDAAEFVQRLARVPRGSNDRPDKPVKIVFVKIKRR
jgi:cyclophilin family peptidyl-prolyl cis-trans isomerase